jgi:SnoaL-like protein
VEIFAQVILKRAQAKLVMNGYSYGIAGYPEGFPEMSYARDEVCAIKYSYALAIDLHDWTSYRELLTDTIEIDFTSLGGVKAQFMADRWTDIVRTQSEAFDGTQHLISNILVDEIEDDRLRLRSYVHATHTLSGDERNEEFIFCGLYDDHLVHRNNEWLISSLTLHQMATVGDPTLMTKAVEMRRVTNDAERPPGRRLM